MTRHFIFVSNNNYLTFDLSKSTIITATPDKQAAWVFQFEAAQPIELLGQNWKPVEVSTDYQNNPGYFSGLD